MQLFVALGTQWRVGMRGPIGLDYNVLPIIAPAMGVTLDAELLASLKVMESAALNAMRAE